MELKSKTIRIKLLEVKLKIINRYGLEFQIFELNEKNELIRTLFSLEVSIIFFKKPYGTDDSLKYLAANQFVGHTFKTIFHLAIRGDSNESPETPCCEHMDAGVTWMCVTA